MVRNLERRRLRIYLGIILGDIAAIFIAFFIAGLVYEGVFFEPRALMEAQLLFPVYVTIALYNRAYSIMALMDMRRTLLRTYAALAVAAALLNFLAFYAKFNAEFSRATLTIGIVLAGIFMSGLRIALMHAVASQGDIRLVNNLVINDDGPGFALPGAIHLKAREHGLTPSVDDPHMLDRLGNYLRHMDRVIVSCSPERRGSWSFTLKSIGVNGEVLSNTVREIGALGVRQYEGIDQATLIVSSGPLGLRSRFLKRLYDLSVAGLAVFLLAPILILAGLAVRMQDGGPAFFSQRRLGRGNRFFTIYKFRTMSVERSDPDGNRSTARDDDRVTRIGKFLRATSIDELPQLLNVLKGDMSIVGPRPHPLGCQANGKLFWEIDTRYWERHALKPGLTGLAQVRGFRGTTEAEQDLTSRLQSDLGHIPRLEPLMQLSLA